MLGEVDKMAFRGKLLFCTLVLALAWPMLASAQDSNLSEPMRRRSTEASADRLLDDGLLSSPEKRALALEVMERPVPASEDPDTLAQFFNTRGKAATILGRSDEARQAFVKASELVPSRSSIRAEIFGNLAQAYVSLGRALAATAALKEANKSISNSQAILRNLAAIAELSAAMGNLEATKATRDECVDVSQKARFERSDSNTSVRMWRETNEQRCEAALFQAQGRYAEAEPLLRKSVAMFDQSPATKGTFVVGNRRLLLADNLRMQGRLADAENETRAALTYYQATLGADAQRTGTTMVTLGRLIAEQGRMKEGEDLARKGIEVIRKAGSPGIGILATLADIKAGQYQWQEARSLFEQMRQGAGGAADLVLNKSANYALALLKTGAADEALKRFAASYEENRLQFGEQHYLTAQAAGFTAASLAAVGRSEEARREFAKAVPTLLAGENEEDQETGNRARDQKLRLILEAYIEMLVDPANPAGASPTAAAESFQLADAARGRTVQRAIAASAARAAVGNPALADLARRTQDSEKQMAALNSLLANAISARAEDQDPDAIAALKKRIARMREERAENMKEIARKFPDYDRMLNPRPATVAEVQARLKPNEALVAFYNAEQRTYAWVVPASGSPMVVSAALSHDDLEATVKHLREALDVSVAGVEEIPPFDLKSAHGLYEKLMQPTEAAWRQAELLFVVPHGAMDQLPLALLPTRLPEDQARPPAQNAKAPAQNAKAVPDTAPLFASYRQVDWLARRVAIAQLPSVGALTTLRALPEQHAPRRTFVAFGDPLFNKQQAEEAKVAEGMAQRGFKRRSAPKPTPDFTAQLAELPRLPDTAEEVASIADVLHADVEQDLFLQGRATETAVRKLDLSKWRIIMFATHGLIPGDLSGLDQPALALTSPEVAPDGGSGLLTMERIMGLKLDADWVVLSACNTASGDGAGAEAASGLGRAFFYAGARALLLSNWPVETVSARLLTTDLFRRQAQDPALSRAKAMQQAMLALIDGPGPADGAGKEQFSYAHPTFWAPFSLLGDGGGNNAAN